MFEFEPDFYIYVLYLGFGILPFWLLGVIGWLINGKLDETLKERGQRW